MIADPLHYRIRPRRQGETGGEWDMIRSWPKKVRRTLTGAGVLGFAGGDPPDLVADRLRRNGAPDWGDCEILDLWRKEALRVIREERRQSHRRRHLKVARRHGHQTYHQYRAALYGKTVHAHAVERGWR